LPSRLDRAKGAESSRTLYISSKRSNNSSQGLAILKRRASKCLSKSELAATTVVVASRIDINAVFILLPLKSLQ
jgi:hypothetical protein